MIFREPGAALYRQLADRLAHEIADGTLQPGQVVPSEQRLMQESGLSRTSVRRAIDVLKSQGLIVVQHGQATRVVDFGEPEEVVVPAGSVIKARMPKTRERARLDMPEGWPVLHVVYPDGSGDLFPANRYCIRVADAAPGS